MTAGHDPDADALRQAQASSAEMYLRLLVEAELRRAVEYPRHLAGRATGGPQATRSADRRRGGHERDRRLPPVSAGTPGERLLDSIAENLLWSGAIGVGRGV